jgi:hypothetical protein
MISFSEIGTDPNRLSPTIVARRTDVGDTTQVRDVP